MVAKRSLALGVVMILSAVILPVICHAGERTMQYYDRGTNYIQKGEYGKAINELRMAIDRQPNNAQFRFTRAELYVQLNRPDLAIADYTVIIANDPDNGKARYNRAVLYYSTKDYDKCWDDVYKAQNLGYNFDAKFIENLKNASGRDK